MHEEMYLGIYNGKDKVEYNEDARIMYLVSMKKTFENAINMCKSEDERLSVITSYEYKKNHYMKHLDSEYALERDELLTKGRSAKEMSDKKKFYVEALKMAYSTATIMNIKKEWIKGSV
jgi:hypothetical protein